MPIELLQDGRFHLFTPHTSYVLKPDEHGIVHHVYWGAVLKPGSLLEPIIEPIPHSIGTGPNGISLHALPLECSWIGSSDYREPLFGVKFLDGTTSLDLAYEGYRIIHGKPPLEGLPCLRASSTDDTDTLEIYLKDRISLLKITLQYSILADYDIITRSVRWDNEGTLDVRLTQTLSAIVDFDESSFRLLHLSGAWAREREQSWHSLAAPQHLVIESLRGSSSHQEQPAIILARANSSLHHGDTYALHLVYSGNFMGFAQVDEYQHLRLGLGIHPKEFEWLLRPGETFQTPEVVLGFSSHGLHGISQRLHQVYQQRLIQPNWQNRPRPIAVNTWEASYFQVEAANILDLGKQAQDLGVELLVVDDGWFGHRNDDKSSLGDWKVNNAKFPEGLLPIFQQLKARGLQVGLWIEPEMVSPDSELYRAHPNWCLTAPNRPALEGRHQLLLDLSIKPVQDWIISTVTDLVTQYDLSYLKWDWNRPMALGGSLNLPAERQGEMAHRYVLGLYRILNSLTQRFPDLLIEGCAGGGGRFDPGMLAFTPQIWPSDNTDAIDRLTIQSNTALLYPISTISAHVSAVPNHQTGREVSLTYRYRVAASGVLGYELNVSQLTEEEKALTREHIRWYKEHRDILISGEYIPLIVDDDLDQASWMFWDNQTRRGIIYWFSRRNRPNQLSRRLTIADLSDDAIYDVTDVDSGDTILAYGSELRLKGLVLSRFFGPYQSRLWIITEKWESPSN